MKQLLVLAAAISLAAAPAASYGMLPAAAPDAVPGSIIVQFASDGMLSDSKQGPAANDERLGAVLETYAVSRATPLAPEPIPGLALYELQFDPAFQTDDILRDLRETGAVVSAEPNAIFTAVLEDQLPPNDPLYPQSWHLSKVNAPAGWLVSHGSPNVTIAVVDTDIDWTHPDLANKMWTNPGEIPGDGIDNDGNGFIDDGEHGGWDFVNTLLPGWPGEDMLTPDNDPRGLLGHGTHVAGIAGAETNNGIGVAGVCRTCRIMALRAGFASASGLGALTLGAINAAILYAAQNGAQVINMSFAGWYSMGMQAALDYAASQGVILVAAAGNENIDTASQSYPASAPNVIGVAATDQTDQKASFSNYGYWVDIAAPGVGIWSTLPANSLMGSGYGQLGGTSMAAPIVSGAAGLILGKNPTLSREQVLTLVKSGFDPLTSPLYLGAGRTNLWKTLAPLLPNFATPVALLSSSMDNAAALGGTLPILGTASGPNFTSYRVDIGAGYYPEQWTAVVPNTPAPIVNGALGAWNAALAPSGTYTLRLAVTAGTKTFTSHAIVNN